MPLAHEEFGGFGEVAAFPAATNLLDFAEVVEGFLELAGEARAVEPESGQQRG